MFWSKLDLKRPQKVSPLYTAAADDEPGMKLKA